MKPPLETGRRPQEDHPGERDGGDLSRPDGGLLGDVAAEDPPADGPHDDDEGGAGDGFFKVGQRAGEPSGFPALGKAGFARADQFDHGILPRSYRRQLSRIVWTCL